MNNIFIYTLLLFSSLFIIILNIKPIILYFHQIYKTLLKVFIFIIIALGLMNIFNINLKINTKDPTYKHDLTYIV